MFVPLGLIFVMESPDHLWLGYLSHLGQNCTSCQRKEVGTVYDFPKRNAQLNRRDSKIVLDQGGPDNQSSTLCRRQMQNDGNQGKYHLLKYTNSALD